jgi:hypothetical protein
MTLILACDFWWHYGFGDLLTCEEIKRWKREREGEGEGKVGMLLFREGMKPKRSDPNDADLIFCLYTTPKGNA